MTRGFIFILNFILFDKITEIKKRHVALESNHQKQANDLQSNHDKITHLEKQINLQETIKQNLESEMEHLINEVSQYRTDIKNVTIEKDNEIKKLMEQLKEFDIYKSKENPDTVIKEPTEVSKTINGRPRGLNIVASRGVTNTSRGIIATKN